MASVQPLLESGLLSASILGGSYRSKSLGGSLLLLPFAALLLRVSSCL
ncbi:ankyrin-2-like protein [Corchorus capsularis]|uniref:Ankyrin-2-like protein n=1 Tax=Corchorus capsularis TaxID=210143 RepID=A0A1R3J7F0_COCAP|nr:ankyrin-2-like protein [Corchorus capsularis]